MLIAALLVALQVALPVPDAPTPPLPFAGAAGLDVVTDDRQSLRGISRLLVSFNMPEDVAAEIDADVLRSTVAFSLEQAGLEVIASRNVDDPALVVSIRVVPDAAPPGRQSRRLYRVDVDVLQLVRLPDVDSSARLMMASTWHAGNFGAVDEIALPTLRDRVIEVVETFTRDWREANPAE